eukprot:GEMP01071831.1.p1 GENE.GEMP01071831.1~~GEMP01071831.1.p1  ORF type:complete len:173 (+),score=33.15 GEMP01071831.1:53-571(+)
MARSEMMFHNSAMTILHALMLGDHTSGKWLLEDADMDISFGHGMLNASEGTWLIAGLLYGVLVMIISLATFSSSFQDKSTLRYVIPLGYVQVGVLVFLTVMKAQYLCEWQPKYYPMFKSTCGPLIYNFILRSIFGIIMASVGLRSLVAYTSEMQSTREPPCDHPLLLLRHRG